MNTDYDIDVFFAKDFDKLLGDLRNEYDRVKNINLHLRAQICDWDKDEEIQAARQQAEEYRKYSLFQCSPIESERIKEFRNRHYDSCKNGSCFQYELTGTGIGTAISIKCPKCGEEENVTDYDCW